LKESPLPDPGSAPARLLEPADRLNEILFGIIMVLTFTLTAGIATGAGPEAGRELLIATVGCNLAWGVIDGAMFLMACLLERSRTRRALGALHAAADEASGLAVVERAVQETLGGDVTAAASAEERAQLVALLRDMALRVPVQKPRLRGEDFLGAAASALLVMLATIPAALPFLFIDEPWRALRLSNLFLLVALFLVGYQWGKHSFTNRWRAGLTFLGLGMALVGVAIALGG
jgi:hypothetical protein